MRKAKVNLVFQAEKETIRFTPDTKATGSPEGETIEFWATKHATPEWLFNATKALCRWPIGKVVLEQDYLEAVDKAGKVELV